MEIWRKTEHIIKNLTGGDLTPGSGNKRTQGDVVAGQWTIEVKSTVNKYIDLEAKWFRKLNALASSKMVCLAIFFNLQGFVYFPGNRKQGKDWVTLRVWPDTLPTELIIDGVAWELGDLAELKGIAKQ